MAMGAAKIRGLLQWCKQKVEGYPGVEVANFTKSFRDGLAFCAIIHRFRPELLDFYALSKENILENNQLAYSVAENELGIPALLDAEDMVAVTVPDRLSIITYVSQYYNYFCNKTPMGGPNVVAAEPSRISMRKKKQTPHQPLSPAASEVHGPELCAICHKTVYMLERHHLDEQLVHRSCLRRNQMKDIGDRVKSLERGAHLKRNLCSSNATKDSSGQNSERGEEGVSATKRRTSPTRAASVVQPKAPEPSVRPNGTARHQPNNLVGHPSPVIPPITDLPPAPPAAPPPKEVNVPPPSRALSPSEGKPIPRPRSPAVPTPPSTPNLPRVQPEPSSRRDPVEKTASEAAILRSRSPTPRLSKADSLSQHGHHKRRAPAPPSQGPPSRPPASYSSAPPRPPSIRTLPVLQPGTRASAVSQAESDDSYPDGLNPFSDAPAPNPLPPSASNDSLPAAKGPSSPKLPTARTKEVPSVPKEPLPNSDDVSFEYHGKNPFDMEDDEADSDPAPGPPPPAASAVPPKAPATSSLPPALPASKPDDGDVSFEYRGKNPFDMDSDDDTGSHDLSSTSGSSLRTSVMRKKRHAPPPPPVRPPNASSTVTAPAGDENGASGRFGKEKEEKKEEKEDGSVPVLEPLASEISPSSTNSGNDISLAEAAAEPSGRKRITVLPEDEPQPTVANERHLRPIRPLDNFHFSSDENDEADESGSANEPGEAGLGDTDPECGSTHTNDSAGPARKGPAPAQPVIGRRCVRTDADEEFVPYAELIAELERLNEEQVLLERKGRQIEEELRNSEKRAPPGNEEIEAAEADAKVDDLMVSWLELIEQKNQLFRRENELHYRIRQRELEERHADIEFELRQLLAKQEHVKTASDRKREEVLLHDLQACVMERSELVYALDEDQQSLMMRTG